MIIIFSFLVFFFLIFLSLIISRSRSSRPTFSFPSSFSSSFFPSTSPFLLSIPSSLLTPLPSLSSPLTPLPSLLSLSLSPHSFPPSSTLLSYPIFCPSFRLFYPLTLFSSLLSSPLLSPSLSSKALGAIAFVRRMQALQSPSNMTKMGGGGKASGKYLCTYTVI